MRNLVYDAFLRHFESEIHFVGAVGRYDYLTLYTIEYIAPPGSAHSVEILRIGAGFIDTGEQLESGGAGGIGRVDEDGGFGVFHLYTGTGVRTDAVFGIYQPHSHGMQVDVLVVVA